MIPEVLEFLAGAGREGRRFHARRAGRRRALLERGDFAGALPLLERAHAEEGRLQDRAETAWAVGAGVLLARPLRGVGPVGEDGPCRRASSSRKDGSRSSSRPGAEPIYGGAAAGARLVAKMEYGRPRIPASPREGERTGDRRDGLRHRGVALAPDRERGRPAGGRAASRGRPRRAVGLHRDGDPDGLRLGEDGP